MINKSIFISILVFSWLFVAGIAGAQENFSLEFDGEDDYVLLPHINAGKEFTLEAWFYPTDVTMHWRTLFKDDWKSNNLGSFYLDPIGNQVDLSWWWGEKDKLFLYNLNLNTWYYFAFVADGTISTLYAIADYQSWQASTSSSPNFNNELKIGETDEGTFYKGQVDNVRIYGRALAPKEIEEHFQRVYKDESGLLSDWNFNEGAGNTLYDSLASENDGVIFGAVYKPRPDEEIFPKEDEKKISEPFTPKNNFFESFFKKILEWIKNLAKI